MFADFRIETIQILTVCPTLLLFKRPNSENFIGNERDDFLSDDDQNESASLVAIVDNGSATRSGNHHEDGQQQIDTRKGNDSSTTTNTIDDGWLGTPKESHLTAQDSGNNTSGKQLNDDFGLAQVDLKTNSSSIGKRNHGSRIADDGSGGSDYFEEDHDIGSRLLAGDWYRNGSDGKPNSSAATGNWYRSSKKNQQQIADGGQSLAASESYKESDEGLNRIAYPAANDLTSKQSLIEFNDKLNNSINNQTNRSAQVAMESKSKLSNTIMQLYYNKTLALVNNNSGNNGSLTANGISSSSSVAMAPSASTPIEIFTAAPAQQTMASLIPVTGSSGSNSNNNNVPFYESTSVIQQQRPGNDKPSAGNVDAKYSNSMVRVSPTKIPSNPVQYVPVMPPINADSPASTNRSKDYAQPMQNDTLLSSASMPAPMALTHLGPSDWGQRRNAAVASVDSTGVPTSASYSADLVTWTPAAGPAAYRASPASLPLNDSDSLHHQFTGGGPLVDDKGARHNFSSHADEPNEGVAQSRRNSEFYAPALEFANPQKRASSSRSTRKKESSQRQSFPKINQSVGEPYGSQAESSTAQWTANERPAVDDDDSDRRDRDWRQAESIGETAGQGKKRDTKRYKSTVVRSTWKPRVKQQQKQMTTGSGSHSSGIDEATPEVAMPTHLGEPDDREDSSSSATEESNDDDRDAANSDEEAADKSHGDSESTGAGDITHGDGSSDGPHWNNATKGNKKGSKINNKHWSTTGSDGPDAPNEITSKVVNSKFVKLTKDGPNGRKRGTDSKINKTSAGKNSTSIKWSSSAPPEEHSGKPHQVGPTIKTIRVVPVSDLDRVSFARPEVKLTTSSSDELLSGAGSGDKWHKANSGGKSSSDQVDDVRVGRFKAPEPLLGGFAPQPNIWSNNKQTRQEWRSYGGSNQLNHAKQQPQPPVQQHEPYLSQPWHQQHSISLQQHETGSLGANSHQMALATEHLATLQQAPVGTNMSNWSLVALPLQRPLAAPAIDGSGSTLGYFSFVPLQQQQLPQVQNQVSQATQVLNSIDWPRHSYGAAQSTRSPRELPRPTPQLYPSDQPTDAAKANPLLTISLGTTRATGVSPSSLFWDPHTGDDSGASWHQYQSANLNLDRIQQSEQDKQHNRHSYVPLSNGHAPPHLDGDTSAPSSSSYDPYRFDSQVIMSRRPVSTAMSMHHQRQPFGNTAMDSFANAMAASSHGDDKLFNRYSVVVPPTNGHAYAGSTLKPPQLAALFAASAAHQIDHSAQATQQQHQWYTGGFDPDLLHPHSEFNQKFVGKNLMFVAPGDNNESNRFVKKATGASPASQITAASTSVTPISAALPLAHPTRIRDPFGWPMGHGSGAAKTLLHVNHIAPPPEHMIPPNVLMSLSQQARPPAPTNLHLSSNSNANVNSHAHQRQPSPQQLQSINGQFDWLTGERLNAAASILSPQLATTGGAAVSGAINNNLARPTPSPSNANVIRLQLSTRPPTTAAPSARARFWERVRLFRRLTLTGATGTSTNQEQSQSTGHSNQAKVRRRRSIVQNLASLVNKLPFRSPMRPNGNKSLRHQQQQLAMAESQVSSSHVSFAAPPMTKEASNIHNNSNQVKALAAMIDLGYGGDDSTQATRDESPRTAFIPLLDPNGNLLKDLEGDLLARALQYEQQHKWPRRPQAPVMQSPGFDPMLTSASTSNAQHRPQPAAPVSGQQQMQFMLELPSAIGGLPIDPMMSVNGDESNLDFAFMPSTSNWLEPPANQPLAVQRAQQQQQQQQYSNSTGRMNPRERIRQLMRSSRKPLDKLMKFSSAHLRTNTTNGDSNKTAIGNSPAATDNVKTISISSPLGNVDKQLFPMSLAQQLNAIVSPNVMLNSAASAASANGPRRPPVGGHIPSRHYENSLENFSQFSIPLTQWFNENQQGFQNR